MWDNLYLWAKALHLIAVIAWMAGLLYLPRLFVYHSRVMPGSEASELFKIMEARLLRIIMNPAMIASFALGFWLIALTGTGAPGTGLWIHLKLALVLILAGMHGLMARYRKAFARDERPRNERYFIIFNEIPMILLMLIVLLVVLKPV